jgi:hypothetical protein
MSQIFSPICRRHDHFKMSLGYRKIKFIIKPATFIIILAILFQLIRWLGGIKDALNLTVPLPANDETLDEISTETAPFEFNETKLDKHLIKPIDREMLLEVIDDSYSDYYQVLLAEERGRSMENKNIDDPDREDRIIVPKDKFKGNIFHSKQLPFRQGTDKNSLLVFQSFSSYLTGLDREADRTLAMFQDSYCIPQLLVLEDDPIFFNLFRKLNTVQVAGRKDSTYVKVASKRNIDFFQRAVPYWLKWRAKLGLEDFVDGISMVQFAQQMALRHNIKLVAPEASTFRTLLQWYQQKFDMNDMGFSDCSPAINQTRIETSSSYFYDLFSPMSSKLILGPDIKILLFLKDPFEKALSDFIKQCQRKEDYETISLEFLETIKREISELGSCMENKIPIFSIYSNISSSRPLVNTTISCLFPSSVVEEQMTLKVLDSLLDKHGEIIKGCMYVELLSLWSFYYDSKHLMVVTHDDFASKDHIETLQERIKSFSGITIPLEPQAHAFNNKEVRDFLEFKSATITEAKNIFCSFYKQKQQDMYKVLAELNSTARFSETCSF